MKEHELRQHATCSLCQHKIGGGLPLFYRLTIERFGINLDAVRRQSGLAVAMGHAVLAQVMGPDEDMAQPVMDKLTLVVCEDCSIKARHCVAALAEIEGIGVGAKKEAEADDRR